MLDIDGRIFDNEGVLLYKFCWIVEVTSLGSKRKFIIKKKTKNFIVMNN